MACSIKEFEPELKRMLREKTVFFKEALSAKINDKVRNWFSRYKLFLPEQEIIVSEPTWVKKLLFKSLPKLQGDIEDYLKEEITKKLKGEQKKIKEGQPFLLAWEYFMLCGIEERKSKLG